MGQHKGRARRNPPLQRDLPPRRAVSGLVDFQVIATGTQIDIADPTPAGTLATDRNGLASLTVEVPPDRCGESYLQAIDRASCATSNLLSVD